MKFFTYTWSERKHLSNYTPEYAANPPSIGTTMPVTEDAASLASYTSAPISSCGSPSPGSRTRCVAPPRWAADTRDHGPDTCHPTELPCSGLFLTFIISGATLASTYRVASFQYREQRGGSHDAGIDKTLQTATSDLLQVAQVSNQAKAQLLGKTNQVTSPGAVTRGAISLWFSGNAIWRPFEEMDLHMLNAPQISVFSAHPRSY